jgi:hypothetical protein
MMMHSTSRISKNGRRDDDKRRSWSSELEVILSLVRVRRAADEVDRTCSFRSTTTNHDRFGRCGGYSPSCVEG